MPHAMEHIAVLQKYNQSVGRLISIQLGQIILCNSIPWCLQQHLLIAVTYNVTITDINVYDNEQCYIDTTDSVRATSATTDVYSYTGQVLPTKLTRNPESIYITYPNATSDVATARYS
jgi:hypothetical protein